MKKLLLALSLSPLAVMGQQFNSNPVDNSTAKVSVNKQYGEVVTSPVKEYKQNPVPRQKRSSHAYDLDMVEVGKTFYDLVSNGAMPRRVVAYPGGKVSVVWTNSAQQNEDFTDRGTGYNHYDGQTWIGQVNRDIDASTPDNFEAERAGWPNIITITEDGIQKEVIVSHYAAGGTGVSGGTFWMENSKVGDPQFNTFVTKDKPKGPIWPRIAATSGKIHHIGAYSDVDYVQGGVKTPVVYYRYDIEKDTFDIENIMLPGYAARAGNGSGDNYAIDAVGDTVAILIGGPLSDLTLWKSIDQGENWTMTIIDSFDYAPWDDLVVFDSSWTSDGTGTVLIDHSGEIHVFYPRMKVANLEANDGFYNPTRGTDGIMHWSDRTNNIQLIASRIDYDKNPETDILISTVDDDYAGYGGNTVSTMPITSIDANGNIFMVYSSPNEEDVYIAESNYRDLYVVYSKDGGATWSDAQAITGKILPTRDDYKEDVFPTMPRNVVDGKLHLVWMQDETPGIFLVNNSIIVENSIMYAPIPVDDILENKLGLHRVGIEEKSNVNNLFSIGEVFPNPATGIVNVPVNMKSTAKVSVKVLDILGKTISAENQTTLGAGRSNLTLDISNLTPGLYFCQVNAGGYSVTQKIIVR